MIDQKQVITFFKNSDNYINNNPIIELRKKIVSDMVGQKEGYFILDVGCGDGSLSMPFISHNQITFLDITDEMLELVKKKILDSYKDNATIINKNILEYNVEQKFDMIICIGVYAHIQDISALTKKLVELLKEDGCILIQFSDSSKVISKINNFKNKIFKPNRYKYDVNRLKRSGINIFLINNGLKIMKETRYWPISPVFSILPSTLKHKALFFFYRNQFLSRFGSEVILLLEKNHFK